MALPSEDAHKCRLDDYIIKSLYFIAYKRGCLFPQSLASNTRWGKLCVLSDGTTGSDVRLNSQEPLQPAVLRADNPIPIYCSVYYFEVTVNYKSRHGAVAVGVCSSRSSLSQWPGMENNSYGYRSSNGAIYHNSDELFATGLPYGEFDVIGCGINFVNNSIFFTKNGVFMGPISAGKKLVNANFGQHKFIFDIGQYVARERAVVVSMAVDRKCNDLLAHVTMRNLVASYLLHNGYLETTRELGKWYAKAEEGIVPQDQRPIAGTPAGAVDQPGPIGCDSAEADAGLSMPDREGTLLLEQEQQTNRRIDFQRLFSWTEPSHLLIQRRLLMEIIRKGDYPRAVKLLEESFPDLVEQDPSIAFVLRCHHFIDLICRQQSHLVAQSAPPTGVSRRAEPVRRRHSFVHCSPALQCCSSALPHVGMAEASCRSQHPHPGGGVGGGDSSGGEHHLPDAGQCDITAHQHSPTSCQAPMRLRLDGSEEGEEGSAQSATCCQSTASAKLLPVFPAHQTCYPSRSEVGFQHQLALPEEDAPTTRRASNNNSPTSTVYDFSEGHQQMHKPDRTAGSYPAANYVSCAAGVRCSCGPTLVETSLPSALGNGIAQPGVGKLLAPTFLVDDPQSSCPAGELPTNGAASTDAEVLPENNGNSRHHYDDHHHQQQQQCQHPYCDHSSPAVVDAPSEAVSASTSLPVQNGRDSSSFPASPLMVNGGGGGDPCKLAATVDEAASSPMLRKYFDEVVNVHDDADSDYDNCLFPADQGTITTDDDDDNDESLLTVVQYGRTLRATALDLQSRNCITDSQISLLMGAFGLIAYRDPYASPFREFLEPAHRDCLADAVNSAIMVHLNQPASPLLNRVLTFLEGALTEGDLLPSGRHQPSMAGGKLGPSTGGAGDFSSIHGSRVGVAATARSPSALVTSTIGTSTTINPSALIPAPVQVGAGTGSDISVDANDLVAGRMVPTRTRETTATLAAHSSVALPSLSTHRYSASVLEQVQARHTGHRYQLLPIDIHSSPSSSTRARHSPGRSTGLRTPNGSVLFPQQPASSGLTAARLSNSSLYIPPSALVSTVAHSGRVRTVTTEVSSAAAMETAAAAAAVASRDSPFRRSAWTSSPSTPVGQDASGAGGARSRPASLQNLVDRRRVQPGPDPVSLASASSPSALTPSTPVVARDAVTTASFVSSGQAYYSSVSSQTGGTGAGGRSSSLLVGYQHLSDSGGVSAVTGLRGAATAVAGGGGRLSTSAAETAAGNTQVPSGPELANFFHPILFTGD